mgnify:CR=1 FL=1
MLTERSRPACGRTTPAGSNPSLRGPDTDLDPARFDPTGPVARPAPGGAGPSGRAGRAGGGENRLSGGDFSSRDRLARAGRSGTLAGVEDL